MERCKSLIWLEIYPSLQSTDIQRDLLTATPKWS